MAVRITAPAVRRMKAQGERVVCVTAYDFPTAKLVDESGADIILVGDSVGNNVLGFENTLFVELDHMRHHVAAVARAVRRALIVADLPFGAYQVSKEQAVESSIALIKAGAQAVKPEGAPMKSIHAILDAGIPVMGHLGMTPQSVHRFGGFRVQGKGSDGDRVRQEAADLDDAGVFAMVLELIPIGLAQGISETVGCPTIGIGAGPYCDGQVQVFHDIMGLNTDSYRHSKRYAEGAAHFREGLSQFVNEVRTGHFPTVENGFEDRQD